MKVFRIRLDINRYPWLVPAPGETRGLDELVFDGTPRGWHWAPLHAVAQPKDRPPADFLKLGHGGMVLSPRACELLRHALERSGELLPVHYAQQEHWLLNCTPAIPCLDPEATEWREVGGKPVHVKRYAFLPGKLPAATVFKIPEQARDRLFTVTGRVDPTREFKTLVQGAGLRGLEFEEVWSDEGPASGPPN